MSALGLARLEPRDVVLATVADARMDEAVSELESLREQLSQITAEVEASEKRAGSTPNHLELPDSVQLTFQFVDDLVSTNRARMRDQVAQRYAWAGERLAGAHAEAQTIVGEALAELAAAVDDHRTPLEHPVADLRPAGLMGSSMPPATSCSPASPVVEPAQDVRAPDADDASVGDPGTSTTVPANDAVASQAVEADRPAESEERLSGQPMEALSPQSGAPESLDGVVDSAVQAILKALAGPGTDARPSPPTGTARPGVTPPAGLLTWSDDRPAEPPSSPKAGEEEPATSTLDDRGPHPDPADGTKDDQAGRGYEHFWRDVAEASESRRSRLTPRDLMVAMLVLVAFVLAGLALIG